MIGYDGLFGMAGWRVMYLGVSVPAIAIGLAAWFYLVDRPADAKWLNADEKRWLVGELEQEKAAVQSTSPHESIWTAMANGRVWVLCLIYFGFVYGLYALAFFLPTIINGFQQQFGTTFNVFQKGLITAIPYLPAAFALYFWSKDATRRGCRTWHIALPALTGAVSIPLALFMGSPVSTVAVVTITACSIFAALPNFWTLPTRFLTGAQAAAVVALINTVGNIAGFSAGYITGALKDMTGAYIIPMLVVGCCMLMSAVLMVMLGQSKGAGAASATAKA